MGFNFCGIALSLPSETFRFDILKMSINKRGLVDYVVSQLNVFFPDSNKTENKIILSYIDKVLERVEYCFSFVNNRYFFNGKSILFNHLHADQYAMFLYFLSHALFKEEGKQDICTKIFYLNKCLHSIDAFYEVELPDIFLFVHPVGTVLGRGKYSNYFLVYQRCNVGSNKEIYPTLKKYVSLHPGASILGNCLVEKNCKISAGSLLMDTSLEENSIYIGNPDNYKIKESTNKIEIWK